MSLNWKALEEGKKLDEKAFASKIADFEWNWTFSDKAYADRATGDAVEIAQALYNKYAPAIRATE